ncbi:MAG: tryptophan synthase subunit beta [bacterium]
MRKKMFGKRLIGNRPRVGYFGDFGGQFVPETLYLPLKELESEFRKCVKSRNFRKELNFLLANYAGRPTPLYFAGKLSGHYGRKIYLKREDLLHTGAHKINNALGQVLLAKYMGKKRLIAETGAGQHGVAAATVSALFGMECVVYMGSVDIKRQAENVKRMELLGAEIRPVRYGTATLKEAVSEAIRDWIANTRQSYYLIGSCVGPHPYPLIVRTFQAVIGKETKKQIKKAEGRNPDYLVACVGGGSNSIGFFHPFYRTGVKFIGVEAGGTGGKPENTGASILYGRPGVIHGNYSYLLQDKNGQILDTHSVAPGLDYPGVGPEHSFYYRTGRAEYVTVSDAQAVSAFRNLSRLEGIIPAIESSHALAYLERLSKRMKKNEIVCVCLSGRGDKDLGIIENRK